MSISASPLAPFRVLDLSRVRAGPTCARFLADFGAEVIRIEAPAGVDPNEAMFANRDSGDFQNLHRNKHSLTLNLKQPEGREIFLKLAAEADVVIENWRPDVKTRLGLDYDTLKAVNPRIILASISGFGQTGPYASRPGFDQIIQGMGGLMSVTGFPGQGPVRAGLAVSDASAGLFAALGVLTALLERERSGQGQWVQASLLHAMIAMMDFQAARYLVDGETPVQIGNDHPLTSPMGLFEAADGYLNLGASGDGNWLRLCRALEQPQWLEDPLYATEPRRVEYRAQLNAALNTVFATGTVAHWTRLLNEAGVPAGPVYSIPQVFEDEQVKHLQVAADVTAPDGTIRQLVSQPTVLSRTPATLRTTAPTPGEHTEIILRGLGYDDAGIAALRAQHIV